MEAFSFSAIHRPNGELNLMAVSFHTALRAHILALKAFQKVPTIYFGVIYGFFGEGYSGDGVGKYGVISIGKDALDLAGSQLVTVKSSEEHSCRYSCI